jgi:hypothetical protein
MIAERLLTTKRKIFGCDSDSGDQKRCDPCGDLKRQRWTIKSSASGRYSDDATLCFKPERCTGDEYNKVLNAHF